MTTDNVADPTTVKPVVSSESTPSSKEASVIDDICFQIRVLTPQGELFSGEGVRLQFRSTDGDVEIYKGYEPSIYTLDTFPVVLFLDDKIQRKFSVHGGFLRVSDDDIVIIADAAETGSKIDLARAEAAKIRAEKRIKAIGTERRNINIDRAEFALKRAIARIKASKSL